MTVNMAVIGMNKIPDFHQPEESTASLTHKWPGITGLAGQ